MKSKGVIYFCLKLFLFVFLCAYFVELSGYYENHLSNQKNLTEAQMKQFESDVQEGKDVDLTKYLQQSGLDYSTPFTDKVSEFSLKLNRELNRFMGGILKVLEKLVS